jgi:hypothetical protein
MATKRDRNAAAEAWINVYNRSTFFGAEVCRR